MSRPFCLPVSIPLYSSPPLIRSFTPRYCLFATNHLQHSRLFYPTVPPLLYLSPTTFSVILPHCAASSLPITYNLLGYFTPLCRLFSTNHLQPSRLFYPTVPPLLTNHLQPSRLFYPTVPPLLYLSPTAFSVILPHCAASSNLSSSELCKVSCVNACVREGGGVLVTY